MDNFKKYLQDNKSKMDVDAPRADMWQAIRQSTNAKKQQAIPIKMAVRYLAAACVAAAIVLGFKWMTANNPEKPLTGSSKNLADKTAANKTEKTIALTTVPPPAIKNSPVAEKTTQEPLAETTGKKKKNSPQKTINPVIEKEDQAIAHIENGYAQMVNLQLNKIRNTPVFAEGPSYFNSFKTQLQQMDKDEADIKKFIKTNGLTDELLEQLINVAQQKLALLKTLQTEINKMNNQVKESLAPADSAKSFFLHI